MLRHRWLDISVVALSLDALSSLLGYKLAVITLPVDKISEFFLPNLWCHRALKEL